MLATNKAANNTSTERLVKSWTNHYIPERANRAGSQNNLGNEIAKNDFYQQLTNNPDTIISIQYSQKEFLSFHVRQVAEGQVVNSGTEAVGLCCKIDGKVYTFNQDHIMQMSNRECNELFQHLGIDGRQFL